MQNIMFTEPNPSQDPESGTKTLTARNWKRKPPKVGTLMTASTGYKKKQGLLLSESQESTIGHLTSMESLHQKPPDSHSPPTDSRARRIREHPSPRLWLTDWDAFIAAYYSHKRHQVSR